MYIYYIVSVTEAVVKEVIEFIDIYIFVHNTLVEMPQGGTASKQRVFLSKILNLQDLCKLHKIGIHIILNYCTIVKYCILKY